MKDTYQQRSDGSISCVLKCPLRECKENFKILYKSYNSSYKRKDNAPASRKPPAKWHVERLHKHLLSPCPFLRSRDIEEPINNDEQIDNNREEQNDNIDDDQNKNGPSSSLNIKEGPQIRKRRNCVIIENPMNKKKKKH